ncbi:MAG TPA: hypothetical protein VLS96_19580 [Nodosilinea sp.]|nr:hypothetical protein [Nodosilinea sp.]
MNPQLLRHLWSLVERSQSNHLLALDDNSLVCWLLEQFAGQRSIDQTESDQLHHYIRAKIPLIRDLVQSR